MNDSRFGFPRPLAKVAAGNITVKNTSGATAPANKVGYIDEAGEYKTTTTAQATLAWCVVITGGANNTDIEVARSGRVTVAYTGAAPSIGDFLTTSAVAGSAQQQGTMRPEIFAVCTAAGAGGTVEVLLLTNTVYVRVAPTPDLYRRNSHSSGGFTATINGAPTATSVVYNAPSAGDEDYINPANATNLARLRIYNSTRTTYRTIVSVDTGTNTITTESSTDSWANTDTITVDSPQVNSGFTPEWAEYDMTTQTDVPLLARAIYTSHTVGDSGGAAAIMQFHPFEAFALGKVIRGARTVNTEFIASSVIVPLIDRKYTCRESATGTGTKTTILSCNGYLLAVP